MQGRIRLRGLAAALLVLAGLACGRVERAGGPAAIRFVDLFDRSSVRGTGEPASAPPRGTEWRFDGEAPPQWTAGPGVTGLAMRDGLLVGHTTSEFPVLHVERTSGLDEPDQLHAIEVRLRVSAGANLSLLTRPEPTVDPAREVALSRRVPWENTTPILAGEAMQTYLLTPPTPVTGSRLRHLLLRPTDIAGAEFAIESVRLVFRREHLAGLPAGVSWQGLSDIFRETLVLRSPETVHFELTLPAQPVLDLAVGTPEEAPVTFTVSVERAGPSRVGADRSERAVYRTRSVTTPHRWERWQVDLDDFAGETVNLALAVTAETTGTIGFWGAPAVRQRLMPATGPAEPTSTAQPQLVVMIQGDTLRRDHLEVYGYPRATAPTLAALAREGVLFNSAITQTGWTKAATPSILTSLYPSTHGVHRILDRLPVAATTVAELYRAAGYATLSYSSVRFTGQLTNLHRGFEELHEMDSVVNRGPQGAKTAREYVDRLVEWLDGHRDVPAFVYLHFFDPHSPYEPNRPYDTMWADPEGRDDYLRQQQELKQFITDPLLARRGMATPTELAAAGIDAASYLRYSRDWYDGAIRGMDREIARLVERLHELGLAERTLLAFFSDHGEEFHDHGRMWHGQSVYGEMIRVPFILWGPARVPAGVTVDEPVQLIDIVPTLLELSGLGPLAEAQGESLVPLLGAPDAGGSAGTRRWRRRSVFAEKQPMDSPDFPEAAESYAVIEGGWKLIHNVTRPPGAPEFELYSFAEDPLDQEDVAAQHPEVVAQLAKRIGSWRAAAQNARPAPDSETAQGLSNEQLEQLRSLGYLN